MITADLYGYEVGVHKMIENELSVHLDVPKIIDNLFNIHNCYTGAIGQVSWKQPNTTCQQLLKMTKQYTRQCTIQSLFDQYPLVVAYQPWMTTPGNSI
jgi:hypothetical protein